ncbi:MAG: amidohydrolase family protein [Bryobacterales bacterium]|nr:amidohydrolase family protein [Bryobacterales bacterium]
MRIDSHQHFWEYNSQDYGWIGDEMRVLRRNFLPDDLREELTKAGIDGAVSVQARQSLAETVWLLDLADEHPFLLGVVGWVPLMAPDIEEVLGHLASQEKLKGVRHVLENEAPGFMLQPDFLRGVSALAAHGLVYDLLLYPRHLEAAIALVDRFPAQRFVVDHIAKPRIRENGLVPWGAHLRELAKRPNVTCKLSGVVTEAGLGHLERREHSPLSGYRPQCFRTAAYDVRFRLAGMHGGHWLRTLGAGGGTAHWWA